MWCAPLQPFVLPVRIRNFEDLYHHEVRSDGSVADNKAALVTTARQVVDDGLTRLRDNLVGALKQPNVKYVEINDGTEQLAGVGSGQLYYLIHDIMTPEDTQSIEQLKHALMKAVLGESVVSTHKIKGKDYFAAPVSRWTEVLGAKPRLKSA